MFGSVIEFKDAALMSRGVIETSGALTRALQGDSFSLFGPDTFRHGICGAAEAELSFIASLLVSSTGFRECSAEIASGLLLFSGVSPTVERACAFSFSPSLTQCVPTREKALSWLCAQTLQNGASVFPHLFTLAMRDARALSGPCLAQLGQVALLSYGTERFRETLSHFSAHRCHHYILSALSTSHGLSAFVQSRDFVECRCFAALERLLLADNRGPVAIFVARNVPLLCRIDTGETVTLLSHLPQGRRMIANLCVSIERDFRSRASVPEHELREWIVLLSCATRQMAVEVSEEERHLLLISSYLCRYLPLYDHVVSSGAFEEATVKAALAAMLAMADAAADSRHRDETLSFARLHQPTLARELLREYED
jgi:hypothetical protein